MGVKIRWLKGVTQPSRLNCRAYLADITPAGSLLCSRCTQGMSRRHPATPLSCRGNQALAAGSETRRRSVDGCVCLRNSPRPCESRSHLSGFPSVNVGLVPPAWQWHLGGEECLINTSPSGRETCPTRQDFIRLRQAYPFLDTRLTHISPIQYTGPHKPFDLHHKITIRHQPNAFLKTLLPTQEECMSKHQMSLCLKLLLGLPIPSLMESSPVWTKLRLLWISQVELQTKRWPSQ
jgi:hypothetical protein